MHTKLLILFILFTVPLSALESSWQELFDGKTLKGWTATDPEQPVKVVDGEMQLLSVKKNLWMVHEGDYKNFELELEVKTPTEKFNSGVGFRCSKEKKPIGFQCEISYGKRTGAVYAISNGWVYPQKDGNWDDFYKVTDGSYKQGEWNKIRIKCVEDHIQIWINEVKTTDTKSDKFTSGSIALQHHGKGPICSFKNIRLREIK